MKEGQEEKNGKIYGCHVDLLDGEEPDGCVLDYEGPEGCDFGILPSGRPRRSKWTCTHWRPVRASKALEESKG